MRTVLRIVTSWLLIVAGGLLALLFGIGLTTADEGNVRAGSAFMLAVALAMIVGGARLLPRRRFEPAPTVEPPTERAVVTFERLSRGGTIVLYPRRWRGAVLLALAAPLLTGSLLMLAGGLYVIGIVGTLLFGAGALAAISWFVPSWSHLRIAPDGLVLRNMGRTTRWAWNDIEHFVAYEIHHQYGSQKMVGFDRRDLTPERQSLWQTITRGMSGVDGSLPDTYGMRHEELADLLNTARDRYATEHGPSPSLLADIELQRRADAVPKDRLPVVTVALAVTCFVAYVIEVDAYGLIPDAAELREAGGASRDALAGGDWWTLLTANVLHASPWHLLFNLIALVVIGVLLEREIGWPRFGLLCLVGGVAAMGLGVLLQLGAGVVGVSGVVYAIAAWAVMRDRHRTRGLGIVAWSILPIGLVYTFFVPGVSIGGHLGGLAAGFALAYLFERRAARRPEPIGLRVP